MRTVRAFKARLHAKFGEAVFLEAQKSLILRQIHRRSWHTVLANALALAILVTPILSLLGGIFLIVQAFPNLLAIVVGASLIALGIALMPRRARVSGTLLRRGQLPNTFLVLDQISEQLKTERVTAVQFYPDFNASMLHAQGERVVGIGVTLWQTLTPDERGAVLAHEIAHQANGDPARQGITAMALGVVEGWLWYLEPDADEFIAEVLMYVSFLLVGGLYRILLTLVYAESQRAEYLADALASKVAGVEAMKSSLVKLTIADERIAAELRGMHISSAPSGKELIDRLAASIAGAPEEYVRGAMAKAHDQALAIDQSHPPTHYRMAFLNLLGGEPQDQGLADAIGALDQELYEYISKAGTEILEGMRLAEDL